MNFKTKFNLISKIVEENIEKSNEDQIVNIILDKFMTEPRCMAYAFEFIVGCRLPQYIRRRKLCVAFQKKENEECKWEDVLEIAGYSERSSFDKAFKKEYGSSPAQYLNGNRIINLVEPIKIQSIEWDMPKSENVFENEKNSESYKNDFKRERMNTSINIKKEKDIENLNKYVDMQALYDLSLPQIMFAEMQCDDTVSMYLACDTLEKEYKDFQPKNFTTFYQDCYYISTHCRYSRDVAEKVVKEIRDNSLLNVRQLDLDYIRTVALLVVTFRNEGLMKHLPYETFREIKSFITLENDYSYKNFCNLCLNIVKGYSCEEVGNIIEKYNENTFESDVLYVMYNFGLERDEAEGIIEAIYDTSKTKIKQMDTEYLWFLEWYQKDAMKKWALKMPYEKYVELKKQVTEQYIYDDFIIEYTLRMALEDNLDLKLLIEIGVERSITEAISALRKNYIETATYSEYYSENEMIEMLDKYYPDKVTSEYSESLENKNEIWKLLYANKDKWEFIDDYEELEFLVAISNGLTIEKSREIVEKQLKEDNLHKYDVDWEYVCLHKFYFESGYFDSENKWDERLIPYNLYRQIIELALDKANTIENINFTALGDVAYDIMFNKAADIEEAFKKHPAFIIGKCRID